MTNEIVVRTCKWCNNSSESIPIDTPPDLIHYQFQGLRIWFHFVKLSSEMYFESVSYVLFFRGRVIRHVEIAQTL